MDMIVIRLGDARPEILVDCAGKRTHIDLASVAPAERGQIGAHLFDWWARGRKGFPQT